MRQPGTIDSTIQASRISVTSASRYSAMPAHTPASRPVDGVLKRRFGAFIATPPFLHKLIRAVFSKGSSYTRKMDDTRDRTAPDWRQALTPEQFRVLREHGTERPGTSPLNAEKRSGTFECAGCGQPLF